MLPKFPRCEKFRFYFKVESPLSLPPYKGAVFRGAIANAFKRTACRNGTHDCGRCMLLDECVYSYVFQSRPPTDFPDAGKYANAPPPYVLIPPLTMKTNFRINDVIKFELVLIGKAVDALPYFIYAFIDIGRRGLGSRQGKYALTRVDLVRDNHATPIYTENGRLADFPESTRSFEYPKNEVDIVVCSMITPLRIKEQGKLVSRLRFSTLFERIVHRVSLLSAIYGNSSYFSVPEQLLEKANTITVKDDFLEWYDWERYSRRQKELMKFGGLIGKIVFAGNLRPFLPFLKIAEMIHVGQGATFGLGKLKMPK